MIPQNELEQIKPGTQVILRGGGLSQNNERLATVERLTKTMIIVRDGNLANGKPLYYRFRKDTGHQAGDHGYYSTFMDVATPENLKAFEERKAERKKRAEERAIEYKKKRDLYYSIDWKPLEEHLGKILGLSEPLELIIQVDERARLNVESDLNLADQAGVMSPVFEELRVQNFGGQLSEDRTKLWLPMHFVFKYKSLGSNGTDLVDATYDVKNKTWSFGKVGMR